MTLYAASPAEMSFRKGLCDRITSYVHEPTCKTSAARPILPEYAPALVGFATSGPGEIVMLSLTLNFVVISQNIVVD